MKQTIDEIQGVRRSSPNATHLLALVLGGVVTALLFVATGQGVPEGPIHSGLLLQTEVAIDPNSRGSHTYTREEGVSGRLFEHFLIVDGPDAVEVIPADRLLNVSFYP